jgi:hypothetical protein
MGSNFNATIPKLLTAEERYVLDSIAFHYLVVDVANTTSDMRWCDMHAVATGCVIDSELVITVLCNTGATPASPRGLTHRQSISCCHRSTRMTTGTH